MVVHPFIYVFNRCVLKTYSVPDSVLVLVSALEERKAEKRTPHAVQRALQSVREVEGSDRFCLGN